MKKFSRKLFLFIALFIGLQSYAQTETEEYEYYDRIPEIVDGEPQYDDDSHPAWITTVDSKEWTYAAPVTVNPDNGAFHFGGNSGQERGTVSSPEFNTDGDMMMDLTVYQATQGGGNEKNEFTFTIHYRYEDADNNPHEYEVEILVDMKNLRIDVTKGTANVTTISEGNPKKYNITVPKPTGFDHDGHVQMFLNAAGGTEIGAGDGGSNKIDVYGDNLVLRDDWDNAERLRRNAGTKMKKVTIVRSYDKGWYTLSLPFDLTMKQFQRRFMANFDKSLADTYTWKEETSAEIWEHTYFTPDSKVMHFEKKYSASVDANPVLKAGVPYLIYIPTSITNTLFDFTKNESTPINEVNSGEIQEGDKVMVFTNITLASEETLFGTANTVEKATGYKFVSNLSKTDLSTVIDNNQIYYLSTDAEGENPVLKKPSDGSTNIKGFRAYFVSPKASASGEAKPFLSFMNEVPNSIGAVETQFNTDERVYNMQGQYVGKSLNDLPRGIYVVNHKKYVIK